MFQNTQVPPGAPVDIFLTRLTFLRAHRRDRELMALRQSHEVVVCRTLQTMRAHSSEIRLALAERFAAIFGLE